MIPLGAKKAFCVKEASSLKNVNFGFWTHSTRDDVQKVIILQISGRRFISR